MRKLAFFVLAVGLLTGCRQTISEREPFHINPNMDWQERFDPQEPSTLFADGRAMRPPVVGTVARGFLREDTRFYQGRDADGSLVATMPVPVTAELLARGQERYSIYCTVCHGDAGDGNGVIMVGNNGQGYGYVRAPSFHLERLQQETDGHFYNVVANGINNMPGYAAQIPVADRWAIVAYVRALQRSQNATQADVPAGVTLGQ